MIDVHGGGAAHRRHYLPAVATLCFFLLLLRPPPPPYSATAQSSAATPLPAPATPLPAPATLNLTSITGTTTLTQPAYRIIASCDRRQSPPGFLTTVFLSNGYFTFGCGFVRLAGGGFGGGRRTRSYYLSVAMSGPNFPNVHIWVANRERPVGENASLAEGDGGTVVFLDGDGNVAWDSGAAGVAALSLGGDGNLVFSDSRGETVWQSFADAPLDVLVPGQPLRASQSLLSPGVFQFLATGRPPTGNFSAEMNSHGLILRLLPPASPSHPLPYFAVSYPFSACSSLHDFLSSPCNLSHLLLRRSVSTAPSRLLSFVPADAAGCQPSVPDAAAQTAELPADIAAPVAFLRLDADGNLRAYGHDFQPSFDLFLSSSPKGLCGIPNACGPFGICTHHQLRPSAAAAASCRCPAPSSSSISSPPDANSAAMPIFEELKSNTEYLLTYNTCLLVPEQRHTTAAFALTPKFYGADICSHRHKFVDVADVDYFANDYVDESSTRPTFELCKEACAKNCSCRAAFYRAATQQCFLHESVLSMIQVPASARYTATIKYWEAEEEQRRSEKKLIVAMSVMSVLSVAFLVAWRVRKGKRKRGTAAAAELGMLAAIPGQPRRFRYRELNTATRGFRHKLGMGGFGSVYRGILSDGSVVAVKQLELYHVSGKTTAAGLTEFRNEVMALSNINHQNLVHLRGFCADGPHRLLVYEFMANGSLDGWLFGGGGVRRRRPLNWRKRHSIAVHTARGLCFLHEQCRIPIVHLDVKPQNILLDRQFVAKLSDFGLSRLALGGEDGRGSGSAASRMRGTPGYMAPECLVLSDATPKSDVYSFGMVLLEIVSGRRNVDLTRLVVEGGGGGGEWYFPAEAVEKRRKGLIREIVDERLFQKGGGGGGEEEAGEDGDGDGDGEEEEEEEVVAEEMLEECRRMVDIALWCIQDEAALRPTMGCILHMLEGVRPVAPPPLSNFNVAALFHRCSSVGAAAGSA